MRHKVKVTVLDKKLYPELQRQYCEEPDSGACPCYHIGDEYIFERDEENDHFWHGGLNTLVKTQADPEAVAGGPSLPHCSEAWDAIARYIYTGLQGGSIMKGWMARENEMIACCSDGTRPVIFKIERLDYLSVRIVGMCCDRCAEQVREALGKVPGVETAQVRRDRMCAEVFCRRESEPSREALTAAVEALGFAVAGIDD